MKRYFRLSFIPLVTVVFLALAACGGAADFDPAAGLLDQFGGSFGDEVAAVVPDTLPGLSSGRILSPSRGLSPATIAAADGQLTPLGSPESILAGILKQSRALLTHLTASRDPLLSFLGGLSQTNRHGTRA